MTDLEKAISLLDEKGLTLALVKGVKTYESTLRGVAPMIGYLDEKIDLNGFSAADKVVGKATAMLFVLAGVKEVHSRVMTRAAADMLESHGIPATFDSLTDIISDRTGTDACPMEKTVADISDPSEGFEAVKKTLEMLRTGAK